MLVVSNTSPILNLALIDKLSLIREQFTTVTIPKGVLEELRVGENLPGSKKILDALDAKWLQVEEVQNSAMLRILKRELDTGEAEAVALALETGTQCVLLDESEARRVAKDLGLKVTGVLGILLRACRQKRIPSRIINLMSLALFFQRRSHKKESCFMNPINEVWFDKG
jgi:predicted nucleic acid-binding protein